MAQPTQTSALRYHSFGAPDESLRLETLDLPKLGDDDVIAEMLAAPINPADFGRIAGTYGELAELPATAGNEGVARIVAAGPQVSALSVGDLVFIPQSIGSWQSHFAAPAEELFRAPEKLPLETAAMGWVNPPTAWRLMHDFVKLQAGDWIIQNAATSAVGKLVIQFARHLGLRTINLVRDLAAEPQLKKLGANIVALDDRHAHKTLEQTRGTRPKLALNSVGGSSALAMAKCLENQGTLVTFGGMDREPAPFPTRYLIFNDIRMRGFWLSRWYQESSRERIEEMMNHLFAFMENSKTSIDVAARYPLSEYNAALAHSQKPGKTGKVLFVNPESEG